MSLTDRTIRNAKAGERVCKLFDGGGMYLLVTLDGAKYWRLKYRHGGKEKLLALGVYPEVTLKEAREKRDEARKKIANGIDPSEQRKVDKRQAEVRAGNTFEAVAREWWEKQRDEWSESHQGAVLARLEKELFPKIGSRPIAEIEAPEVLDAIRAIERRGALEWASKTMIAAGQVFRYAIATSRAKSDPTRDLRGALKRREVHHYARLKDEDLPEFLRKLDAYVAEGGAKTTQLGMKLLVLTWVRTAELRGAKWPEFNAQKAEWRIPADRMKGGIEHVVPLSRQALEVIEELRKLNGHREYVLPNEHDPRGMMSENTILFALYRMGYRGRATGHGFRATASTIMNEQGWNRDWIERQLAHKDENSIRATYNFAEHLPERRKMLQHWADYLDRQSGENVTEIKRAA